MPDNVSIKEACLLEPVSVIVRLMDKANIKFGERVLICGGGHIGLLALQAAHINGAAKLTLVEPIEERRQLALSYGAEQVIDPTIQSVRDVAMELTDGRGYDVVIDCSGSVKAVYDLHFITAKGGKLLYAAMYPTTTRCLKPV